MSHQSEQTVIGCMMHWPDTVPDILNTLTADDFTVLVHQRIFDAFAALSATSQDLDIIGLSKKISKDDLNYFMTLEEPGSSELVKPAMKQLRQDSRLRELSAISDQIRIAINAGEDISSLVAELYKKQTDVPDSYTIYGVDRLAAEGSVIIYFDRKSADISHDMLLGVVSLACTTNCKKLSKINWSVLSQRKIIIWRGEHADAADHLYHLITTAGAAGVRIIRNPSDVAKGFGIIEAHEHVGWGDVEILDYIKANIYDPKAEPAVEPRATDEFTPVTTGPSEWNGPFQCLGHDHNNYFFLPQGSSQVVTLSASMLTQSHFITLAPVNWWEGAYPANAKGAKCEWNSAANAMVRMCEDKGVYDPSRLRGRGAWEDAGRSVLHLGNRIYINGEASGITDIRSEYIYEAAAKMEYDLSCNQGESHMEKKDIAMGAKEAHKVLEICELLAWERPIYALQLAGWIAIAPMCGALVWRPHIHITGKHGSGKSTVMEKIVAPLVGPAALQFLGSGTSAAGIRQTLGSDARPVIHDEFDTGKISDKMVNDELELARSCSSETEAVVAKGGADGHAKTYRSRACFCWASIVTHADMAADLSRVSILTLVENGMDPDDKRARYDKLMEAIVHTFTKEFCCAFRARMVRLIPQIKKNAQTFARAGALCVGTQRAGDQMGGILAGAYALSRSDEISLEAAIEWINARDWSDYRISEDQQDEHRCLAKILQTIMKVQGDKGMADKNIGELVAIAASPMTVDGNISAETAEATLSRNGIRIVPEHNAFVISNTHTSIAKFLEKTPWVNNWAESLARLPNAMKAGTKRFAGAPPAKCVLLPLDLIHGDGT